MKADLGHTFGRFGVGTARWVFVDFLPSDGGDEVAEFLRGRFWGIIVVVVGIGGCHYR